MKDKKKMILYLDASVLKAMIEAGSGTGRWLTTKQIADQTKLNWKTVFRHLIKLQDLNYVTSQTVGKRREYKRNKKNVKSERKIEWTLKVKENPELNKTKGGS